MAASRQHSLACYVVMFTFGAECSIFIVQILSQGMNEVYKLQVFGLELCGCVNLQVPFIAWSDLGSALLAV